MKKLRFSLDVPAEDFFKWFWHYTVSEEGIYICQLDGQDAYFAFDGHSTRQELRIEGYRGEPSARIAEPWLIRFAVNDHGKRITVAAEQRDIADPALAAEVGRYYALLLAAIAEEYPEARAAIAPTEPQPAQAEQPRPAEVAPIETQPAQTQQRKGGPVPMPEEDRLRIVRGWLAVQGRESQENYCNRVGVAPSTLRHWRAKLEAEGQLAAS